MRHILLSLSMLMISNLLADELSWVNEQVQAIKPPRVGMKNSTIATMKDPFIFFKPIKDKEKVSVNMAAKKDTKSVAINQEPVKKHNKAIYVTLIMNKSAMINKKWYKVGDSLYGYKVAQIDSATVVLKNQTNKLLLSTKSKNKKLKFQR